MELPERGTKEYQKIIDMGCGGYWAYSSNGDDFDCLHEYEWSCDVCPINDIRPEEVK